MRRPLFWLLLTFLLPVCLFAQTDRVIFSDGTVKRGLVRRTLEFDLGQAVQLLNEGDGEVYRYQPGFVTEVRTRQGRVYRTVLATIPDPKAGGLRKEQVRLGEMLMDGDFELLRVNLAGNEYESKAIGAEPYLYVLRQGDVNLTLDLRTIVVYELLNANPSRFRNILEYFVRDCPEAERMADEASFNNSSIIRTLRRYADCRSELKVKTSKQHQPSTVRFDHSARLSLMDIRSAEYNDQQFTLGVGYRIEARVQDKLRWLSVLGNVDYVYQTFRFRERQILAQSMVKVGVAFAAAPVQRERFGLQAFGGLTSYNAFDSSFRSFFNNNYFLLTGGLRTRINALRFELSYEHMPNVQAFRPSNILLLGVEYDLSFFKF